MRNSQSLLMRMYRWWQQVRPFVEDYRQKNLEELREWGTRRAERELRSLGLDFTPHRKLNEDTTQSTHKRDSDHMP